MPPSPSRSLVVLAIVAIAVGCAGADAPPAPPDTVASTGAPTDTETDGDAVREPVEATAPSQGRDHGIDDPNRATPGPLPELVLGPAIITADEPVDAKLRPGTDDLWVAERAGRLLRYEVAGDALPGSERTSDVVFDASRHVDAGVEEGLLGFTFDAVGDSVFINVTTGGETRITRYGIAPDGRVDTEDRRELLRLDQPYEAHNGGDLHIGPDGNLYVFTGDGGFVGDPDRVALDPSSPLGKVLRLDPLTGRAPFDNPLIGVDGALDLVWSTGLRNPWRASFDPQTGDLWITDVGDFGWEEVNLARALDGGGRGISFGWSAFEGPDRFNEDQPAEEHVTPWLTYRHGDEGRCSITGGERYRGDRFATLEGWYVFADFCDGVVRAIEVSDVAGADPVLGRSVILGDVPVPVSIRPGPDGGLLVVSIAGGIHPVLDP